MRLYSDFPLARLRQIVADVTAVALVVLSIIAGSLVHDAVLAFTSLGRQLERAGTAFSGTMTDVADAVGGVPFLGDDVRRPFDDATGTGEALTQAGIDQQALVEQLALVLGLLVALVPVVIILRHWLARRIAFARRASTAAELSRSAGGRDLLALRALERVHPRDVLSVAPDAALLWRSADPEVIRALAELALRDAGVRARGLA